MGANLQHGGGFVRPTELDGERLKALLMENGHHASSKLAEKIKQRVVWMAPGSSFGIRHISRNKTQERWNL